MASDYFEAKKDQGKLQANILFEDFPLAIKELMKVCDYGAKKYTRSSWRDVPDAFRRYMDARARHFLEFNIQEDDEETHISHLLHEAWNCIALAQMKLEQKKKEIPELIIDKIITVGGSSPTYTFNPPYTTDPTINISYSDNLVVEHFENDYDDNENWDWIDDFDDQPDPFDPRSATVNGRPTRYNAITGKWEFAEEKAERKYDFEA